MEPSLKFEVVRKLTETKFRHKELSLLKQFDATSPPSVFIGSQLRYPDMNVGILSPLSRDEQAWVYDAPRQWAQDNYAVHEVSQLREQLLNSRFKTKATAARTAHTFVEIAKQIALAAKPVDIEIHLKHTARPGKTIDRVLTPNGLSAPLKKASVSSNVSIPQKIERLVDDDVKASQGIRELHKAKFDEYTLSKILSVGVLGMKKNRTLVPTRWSITATDDMIGKDLLTEVKTYPLLDSFELCFGEFMGNQYILLLLPRVFSFELFELYFPGSSWNPTEHLKASTDYESYSGRTSYAFQTAGGYYATRLPLVEYLHKRRRQAAIIAIRLETPTYWASLGVWVVRESVRKALETPMRFSSEEELLSSAQQIAKIKFDYDPSPLLSQSKILKEVQTQSQLREWL